jgi:hypothetical protein
MISRALVLAFLLGSAAGALACLPTASIAYPRDPHNSLHDGAASVQFLTFGGGYQTPFQTSGLYFKTHLSDRTAFRVGVDFDLKESSAKDPLGDDVNYTANTRNHSVGVSSEFQRYIDGDGSVTVFLGFGPYWSWSRSYFDYARRYLDFYGPTWVDVYQSETRGWEVGASASVGFEWFFKRKLSLLGRVGSSVGFGKRHEIRNTNYFDGVQNHPRVERFDATTVSAGISAAALGIGVYF